MILYLHGFRSSPNSTKARMLGEYFSSQGRGDQYLCPQLDVSPAAAAQQVEALCAAYKPNDLTLVGSSLGGFYATWVAERIGCRAVLLNPAVRPDRDLRAYLGPQTVYHSEVRIEILPQFIDELANLRVDAISRPERYLLIAAKGDEVLDWREMVAHYPGARHRLIEGSDHGLSDFGDHMNAVLGFSRGVQEPLHTVHSSGFFTEPP